MKQSAESQKLRANEERLQLALAAAHSGVWDWDMTREAADVSPSYREMFGLPSDYPVTYDAWLAAVHPEDRDRCRAYGEAFFAGPETEWRLEFRIVNPKTGVRWQRAVGRVYRDVHGKPLRFIGVNTDITEEHRALAALRESEERFRAMADGLPLVVWMHDAEGNQQFVNRTFLDYFGSTAAQLRGDGWQRLLHPEDGPVYAQEFLACTREKRPFHGEVRVRNRDGEWRVLESWARPRFSGEGEFLGMVGTSVDVTERRRMEQALRDADRRKDEFLAMLGHELRNPVAAMLAAMELFRHLLPDDPKLEEVRAATERQATMLRRLVDDLLDSARISTGKIQLRRKPLLLREVLNAALETSRPYIESRHHRLTVRSTDERLAVSGDQIRLVQVISNLLHNAARYTPEHGLISVGLERSQGEAVLTVRDNGIGIPPEMLGEIFGLFVQGAPPPSGAHRGPGLGLGLTLVKRLVELHDGTIVARSEGSGLGSEFIVRLPLVPEPAATTAPKIVDAVRGDASRRVLMVDDNRDASGLLSHVLRILGHEVREAHDGRSALEAAAAFCPHLVVLDVGLPDMDGREVARRLRALPSCRETMIVAVSGFAPRIEDQSPEGPFDRYFLKPVDLSELRSLLQLPPRHPVSNV